MAKGKEGVIQKDAVDALNKLDVIAFAYTTSAGRYRIAGRGSWLTVGFKGLSDICGMLSDGRHLAIEVKRPGETPTDEQIDHIIRVLLNGGVAFWIDTVDGLTNRVMKVWVEQKKTEIIATENLLRNLSY